MSNSNPNLSGLGNLSATTQEGKAWLEWARENTDRFREELNQIIGYLDQITK